MLLVLNDTNPFCYHLNNRQYIVSTVLEELLNQSGIQLDILTKTPDCLTFNIALKKLNQVFSKYPEQSAISAQELMTILELLYYIQKNPSILSEEIAAFNAVKLNHPRVFSRLQNIDQEQILYILINDEGYILFIADEPIDAELITEHGHELDVLTELIVYIKREKKIITFQWQKNVYDLTESLKQLLDLSFHLANLMLKQNMAISYKIIQGRKAYQEDRLLIQPIAIDAHQGILCAVMDGHNAKGKPEVASILMRQIKPLFLTALKEYKQDIRRALWQTYVDLARITNRNEDGSTLSTIYIPQNQNIMYVAVLGDSPIALYSNDNLIFVAPEHNVINPLEEKRVTALGAEIIFYEKQDTQNLGYLLSRETGHLLQLTRTMGDFKFNPYLSRQPEIFKISFNRKNFSLLLATDGIFYRTPESHKVQLYTLLNIVQRGLDAEELVYHAYDKGSSDNISAILLQSYAGKSF